MSEAQPKESLRQKFKNLFGKKSGSFTVQVKPTSEIFLITEEHLKGLGPESPGSQRLKVLKDLCELVTEKRLENVDDKTLHSKLKNTPPDFKRSDLLQSIYPVLSSLASYHAYLDQNRQTALVESLEHGLVSKCAQLCVKALTLCTIEMQTIMVRLMPSMLLKLSHISATKMVAIPMIEFLSSLTRLPRLYASFNEDQYMSIFAIALPYTNPFKFTLYVVSLAHHVIAMWFIKCRLPFRRDFVSFITKGLRSNALPLFDKSDPVLSSEVRLHRSSSLTERTPLKGSYISSQPTTPTTATGPGGRGRGMTQDVIKTETPDELLNHLHLELTETCIDLMARYAFSTCAAMPRRSPVAEFLLAGGQSQSWLLGNKLVTITTTGSGLNGNKSGLCDKCTTLLRRKETPMPSPREEQSLQVDLTEDQLSASVTIAQTATQRLRQRCKSGSSNRVDSSGNLIPLKPLPREDTKEVKYLSLIASRKSQDSLNSVDSENGISFSASKQDAGLSGRPSHLEVKSHDYTPYLCSCWCQGWAEVHIRCPTGNTSWMMKIQNQPTLAPTMKDLPITDLSEMLLTNVEMETELMDGLTPRSPRGGSFGTSEKKVPQLTTEASLELLDKTATVKKLFPLRRSNSSPGLLGKTDGGEEQHCAELPDVKPSEEDDQFKRMKMRQSKSAIDPMESVRKYSDPTTMKAIMDARKRRSPIKIGSKPSKSDEVQRNTSVVKKDDTPMKAKSATEIAQARSRQISSKIRMGQLEKQPNSIDLPVATVAEEQCQEDSLPPLRRARGYTVSVMSPAKHQYLKRESPMDIRKKRSTTINDANNLNPSFVFLQLYHSSFFGTGSDKPLLLPQTQVIERAVKVIDRIPPYETHKIGVVYVGPGQVNNQAAILSNIYGSSRYVEFLRGLGKLINLKDSEANEIYTGGLDCTGYDGKFAYSWQDDVMQVIFHVATLMPNRSSDPNCNEKKLHIGNDFVTIIYNDSNQQYQLGTIKGQFNFVEIVIQPVDNESNTVTVQAREDLMENSWPKIVSDKNVAMLVRQMALHANLASLIHQSTSQGSVGNAYASNWLERLRLMKRLRHKIQQEQQNSLSPSSSTSPSSPSRRHYATRPRSDSNIDDFTDFV
ncbi:tuberin-like [Saccoglossus kowalevskii]|uniref:Tuberin-like n=1 Tax=Saccoglossus kowalevskii TaxID=10224 RepID=A0ABM0GZ29_SACKO|nr:PREDICTED: tuberin-like [Saccoglossus kowalevskii]